MYNIIKKYMPEINVKLFQMSLIYIDDIEDENIEHLNPKYKIKLKDIQFHFEKEIKEWINK